MLNNLLRASFKVLYTNTKYLASYCSMPRITQQIFISHFSYFLLIFLTLVAINAHAVAPKHNCDISIVEIKSAKSLTATPSQRPKAGWQAVNLPDNWDTRWQNYSGGMWYQISLQVLCRDKADASTSPEIQANQNELLAVYIDHISMAGAVYINDELLWQDRHLQEPLSRSWNKPRYWPLPFSLLNRAYTSEANTVGRAFRY